MQVSAVRASDIIPEYAYHDADAGIAFLEAAFGFETQLVVPNEAGGVAHAELRIGRDYVFLSSATHEASGSRVPKDLADATTGSAYIATPEVASLFARARAAGGRIVRDLAETDYGSLDFSVRDGEGFLWHVGTYRPLLSSEAATPEPKVYAGMRYERAREAFAFLEGAFGFSEQFLVPGEGDSVAHAQLSFGNAIAMFGSARPDEFNMKVPRELGGANTQTLCAYVADPDAHYARAKAAGARILVEPENTPYGARQYVAADSEGYVWNFSTYKPGESASS